MYLLNVRLGLGYGLFTRIRFVWDDASSSFQTSQLNGYYYPWDLSHVSKRKIMYMAQKAIQKDARNGELRRMQVHIVPKLG